MPKLKTRKTIAKRFIVKKSGKILKLTCGQNHFNARESGKTTRSKRRNQTVSRADYKIIKSNVNG